MMHLLILSQRQERCVGRKGGGWRPGKSKGIFFGQMPFSRDVIIGQNITTCNTPFYSYVLSCQAFEQK